MSLLSVRNLSAFYGTFQALFDVSLEAAEGETVAVIGANGAGKTTFLRSVAGVLPDEYRNLEQYGFDLPAFYAEPGGGTR